MEHYQPNDIVEVINSRFANMREVHDHGGECSFWLANDMVPPLVGQRFRVIRQEGRFVWVYAGGADRTGFPHRHQLDISAVRLYERNSLQCPPPPPQPVTSMNADIDFCLKHLKKAASFVIHQGRPFLPHQLKAILLEAQKAGLKTINEIPDELVQRVLEDLKPKA